MPDTVIIRDLGSESFSVTWRMPRAFALAPYEYVVYLEDISDSTGLTRNEIHRGGITNLTVNMEDEYQRVWVTAVYPNGTESKGYVAKLYYGSSVSENTNPGDIAQSTAFPNPFNGSTVINVPKTAKNLIVYDISGRLIKEEIIENNTGSISFSPKEEKSGIYLYRFTNEDGTVSSGRLVYIR
jgi:hypothetical protein